MRPGHDQSARGARPERTLAVFHLAETSGPSRSLDAELGWLAEGGSLEVLVPGQGGAADSFAGRARVTTLAYEALTLPRGPSAAARALRGLGREARAFRSLLRERRPELVVIASAMLPAPLLAARREGIPSIVYAGELFEGLGGATTGAGSRASRAGKGVGARMLTGMVGSLADRVMACSRAVAAQYAGARRAQVSVLYPAIQDYSGGDRDSFRDRLGLGPGEPCIAAVGNITENRGQDVLVKALAPIRAEVRGAHCAIVGAPHPRPRDEAFMQRLVELASRRGVGDAVSFTGHLDRVADVYAGADLIVNPRRSGEAFGRVACEALVAGRPVVAMREGAVPEVLRDAETALLVPPNDPEALARAAVRLLEDTDLASRLVAEGRRDVMRRFSPQRSLAEFRSVVEGLWAAVAEARERDAPRALP